MTTILYLSCKKKEDKYGTFTDRCKSITCKNGGTCNINLGYCECPDDFGGSFCEYKCPTKDEMIGMYVGNSQKKGDTVVISLNSNDKKLDVSFIHYGKKVTYVCDIQKNCGLGFVDSSYTYFEGRHLHGGLDLVDRKTLYLSYINLINAEGPGKWEGTKQ